MSRQRDLIVCGAITGVICGLLSVVVPAISETTVLGPFPTGCSLNTPAGPAVIACLPANPSRKLLTVCNVGSANTAWIAPAPITPAANGAGSIPIPPVASNLATCLSFPGSGNLGGNGAAWSAIPSATPVTLTFLEYTG